MPIPAHLQTAPGATSDMQPTFVNKKEDEEVGVTRAGVASVRKEDEAEQIPLQAPTFETKKEQ